MIQISGKVSWGVVMYGTWCLGNTSMELDQRMQDDTSEQWPS
jgi:hypothetical protein